MILAVDVGNTQTVLGPDRRRHPRRALAREHGRRAHRRRASREDRCAARRRRVLMGRRRARHHRLGGPEPQRRVRADGLARHGRAAACGGAGCQDRHGHPVREPARSRCRPDRQRRGRLSPARRSGRRRRLRHRHDDRRHRRGRRLPRRGDRPGSRDLRRSALLARGTALEGRPRAARTCHRDEHARERAGGTHAGRGGHGRRARASRLGRTWIAHHGHRDRRARRAHGASVRDHRRRSTSTSRSRDSSFIYELNSADTANA